MSDAPANAYPYRTPKGPRPRKPRDGDGPAHYRLSRDTWALILAEYREGATVPELSLKWRVSAHAVRKQITNNKSTKRDWGDEQAIAQAQARAADIEAARAQSPEARAERLFDPAEEEEDAASDPTALASTATLASGRAMKGRLWAEAKALAGLAESYSRLADRKGGGASAETMDLHRLFDIIEDTGGVVGKRFKRHFDGRHDPDQEIKDRYWHLVVMRHEAVHHNLKELMFRALRAERELKALGGTPSINPTDVEIEEWVRHWLGEPLTEANHERRTKLGEWPWR